MQAVSSSKHYTGDLDTAEIVLVNDYCYYMWWLEWVRKYGGAGYHTPGTLAPALIDHSIFAWSCDACVDRSVLHLLAQCGHSGHMMQHL